ncbi:MAG: endolytic transglycosylase MltG [Betaproteobacteria bacterium]|nr:endolytic transglycosylase MltG [Betaproteobacteria bacterium]
MRFFLRLFQLACFLAILAGGLLLWVAVTPVRLSASPLDFQVLAGSSARSAARQIAEAGIGLDPRLFEAIARITRNDAAIKAGSYEIEAGITPWELLRKLTRGDVSQAEIAFIEGWNFRQLREKLNASPDLHHDSQLLSDQEILQRIGATESHPEGLFFPDTYLFGKQSSDLDLLARAYRAMKIRLAQEWAGRAPGLPYQQPYQALIMASIVEKETGKAQDRPLIAAVFVNRLKHGMLLQTDPTVIYGMGTRFDGNLRRNDLLTDTPYNTYTRAGLPPSPIAMAGIASLQAALHPANSEALYFVARGDGSSHFSTTLDEHNRAVSRYQRGGH